MYLRYAKPYLTFALPITLISWWMVYAKGPGAVNPVLFLKIASMIIGLYVLRRRHRFDIFFYQNVGYGERQLLAITGAVDIALWLFAIILLITTLS